jgi:hypothetical protein
VWRVAEDERRWRQCGALASCRSFECGPRSVYAVAACYTAGTVHFLNVPEWSGEPFVVGDLFVLEKEYRALHAPDPSPRTGAAAQCRQRAAPGPCDYGTGR